MFSTRSRFRFGLRKQRYKKSKKNLDEKFLDALGSASQRTRQVLMVIQLFSLLVAVMVFNSLKVNWTESRLDTARDAQFLYSCLASEQDLALNRETAPESQSDGHQQVPFEPKEPPQSSSFLDPESWKLQILSNPACPIGTSAGDLTEKGIPERTVAKFQNLFSSTRHWFTEKAARGESSSTKEPDAKSKLAFEQARRCIKGLRALQLGKSIQSDSLTPMSCEAFGQEAKNLFLAALFIEYRRYSKEELRDYVNRLEQFRLDHVTSFPVPFVGVRVDVNSLGLFANFGFLTLFVWFGLSLGREKENVAQVREHPNKEAILRIIRVESLFAPLGSYRSKKIKRFQKRGTLGLLCLWMVRWIPTRWVEFIVLLAMGAPVALLTAQLANDLSTLDIGIAVNPWFAFATVVGQFLLFSINTGVFLWCWARYCLLLEEWELDA